MSDIEHYDPPFGTDSDVSPDDLVFDNERYAVMVVTFEDPVTYQGSIYREGYGVYNKKTGIAEVFVNTLPGAISTAEQLDLALATEPWSWMRLDADATALALADGKEVH